MKTLLLNGCSFGECWTPTQGFVQSLGCDHTANISKMGTSFNRTCRSTIEWIAQNGNPEFAIIPITFSHRWEMAIARDDEQIEGTWFPIQMPSVLETVPDNIDRNIDIDKLKQMIENYHALIPNIRTYWDRIFTDVIMLSGFLHSRSIKHLVFDMCNEFNKEHIQGFNGFDKIRTIEENKNILDLFSFCGNRYMWNTMPDKESHDFNMHHGAEQYKALEKHLLTCINP